MATLKRNWVPAISVFMLILVLLAGLAVSHFNASPARADEAQASAKPTNLEAVDYSQLCELRQSLCLDDNTLAAIGCNGQTAVNAVSSLASWYSTNKVQLQEAQKAQADAGAKMRELTIAAGKKKLTDAEKATISPSMAAVSAADKQHKDLLDLAATAVGQTLTDSQKSLWNAGRQNRNARGDYQFLSSVSAEQSAALSKGLNAGSGMSAVESSALTADHRATLATVRANRHANVAGVRAALKAAFPTPKEFTISDDLTH